MNNIKKNDIGKHRDTATKLPPKNYKVVFILFPDLSCH